MVKLRFRAISRSFDFFLYLACIGARRDRKSCERANAQRPGRNKRVAQGGRHL
jgi:hypothetical protein